MSEKRSPLDAARAAYEPRLPSILRADLSEIGIEDGGESDAVGDDDEIRARFPRSYGRPPLRLVAGSGPGRRHPLKVGVVLSGGQAPGGHNVITGLHDGLRAVHPDSKLYGFLGGPRGIVDGVYTLLDAGKLAPFRNTGGFDLIGSGRDKIETDEQIAASHRICGELGLDGLVVVGGDDSNTNAAVLAESFLETGSEIAVVGVPKTIDGDMKGESVETSFGFDTATRVYAALIGNICRDARSAAKYWHFVKLMGRSASHVTLECALQTHANLALIGEEVERDGMTLAEVVDRVADGIRTRASAGKNYGVCLIPEGLVEFIPEMRTLIGELNAILTEHQAAFEAADGAQRETFVADKLSTVSRQVFAELPAEFRAQLLIDRDSHGNVQVSKIDTERLLIQAVRARIEGRFSVQGHFFGYEGRCAAPTNFDADYTYALGRVASLLTAFGRTGYLCGAVNLAAGVDGWRPLGVPLTSLMQMERRKGKRVPVIRKALVDLAAGPFAAFAAARARWLIEDDYRYPGAIQYFGPAEVTDACTETLRLEASSRGAEQP